MSITRLREPGSQTLVVVALLVGGMLCLGALSACAHGSAQPRGAAGSPADIRIKPGPYPGYEIRRGCLWGSRAKPDAVAVIGTGKKPFSWLPDGDIGASMDRDLLKRFRVRALAVAATDVPASGETVRCSGTGSAFSMYLSSYHVVDAVAHRLGAWLASEDLRGEIVLEVTGPIYNIATSAE